MSDSPLVARLKATPADPSKAGAGSVWDHLSITARGLIPLAQSLGASDDRIFNVLVNSDYGVGSHDGGMTAMFDLLRELRGGGAGPVDPGQDPSTNDRPPTQDPVLVLDYALQGFDWSGTPVANPPTNADKFAFYNKCVNDPAYAKVDLNLLMVLCYTLVLKPSYAFGENVPSISDYENVSFADWCKGLVRGLPSL